MEFRQDISPLLLGQTKESPHEARYYYAGYKLQAVRVGPWKLAIAPQSEGRKKGDEMVPASMDKPRLYNLDTDIGERNDVAAKHPDVVSRLKALAQKMAADLGDGQPGPGVRPAGFVENPVTLYPTEDGPTRKGIAKKKSSPAARNAKSVSLDALKAGDALDGESAPQVANRPITITCEVESKSPDGVIVAHGGKAVGYSLYFKGGRVMFTVRAGQEPTSIAASETPTGRFSVKVTLAAGGQMRLAINGKEVATGKSPGLLHRQPQERFCVGFDDAVPVADYGGKAKFEGTIEHLKVTAGVP